MAVRLTDIIGLQTPGGRLLFFGIATVAIFIVPYGWLANLSLWQHLGIPSPSIGLTRAYWLLIHGDIFAAWERNRLIFVVIGIGGMVLLIDVAKLIKGFILKNSLRNKSR